MNNRELLELELGDVQYWIIQRQAKGDLNKQAIVKATYHKSKRVSIWLHHQETSE